MLARLLERRHAVGYAAIPRLYNEQTFYTAFEHSLAVSQKEILIESPFITRKRLLFLLPQLRSAVNRGVSVIINTRDPREHEERMKCEAEEAVHLLQNLGATILFTGKLHRKLAIIDRKVVWDGSLNILSQQNSCEVMRKTVSSSYAQQLLVFTGMERFLPD